MPKRDDTYMAGRRDEILDAAVACLTRTGLAGLSTTAICKEAGISMGALYTHFATKDDIVLGIAERSVSRRRRQIEIGSAKALRRSLMAMAESSAAPIVKAAMRVDLELLSAAASDPRIAKAFEPFHDNRDLQSAIEALKAKGEIPAGVDAEAAAAAIEGVLAGLPLLGLMGGKYARSYRAAMGLVLDGILPL
jgi:AcrR family transcriptional regulator